MSKRTMFTLGTLAFCAGTIVWLLVYGRQGNSLHDSAMSWSWLVGVAMLATEKGLDALPEIIGSLRGNKSPVETPTKP